ncbi:MAG TPA: DUF86 domain-containing protein [Patescibacteria group bacterium]|nr:DUF86 domain-containing protein [Patescibacteria group bacterium]
MSIKDWRVRIEDILEAIERVARYTHDMSEAEFVADDRSVDAVVRNLEIIGEAAHRLPFEVQQHHADIPWSRMAEMRHILIHEYHSVNAQLIWATVHHDIPPLAAPLRAILHDEVTA